MARLLIIAQEPKALVGLSSGLTQNGFTCHTIPHGKGLMEQMAGLSPDLVMVETDGHSVNSEIRALVQRMKQDKSLPVVALVPVVKLSNIDGQLDVDDFLVSPYDVKELVIRTKRLLLRAGNTDSEELIKCNGLVIDLAKCEVIVGGRAVELTFKEYELLKLLASTQGRVYTREALLNKIWGYDYFGGDRTVDVHVRRLRSKIEDSTYTFIETVRNIGYRFRKDL